MEPADVEVSDVVRALHLMDTHMQQGFAAIVAALKGVQVSIERLEQTNSREVRIVGDSIRSMDTRHGERLNGMDDKLSELAGYGKLLLDRSAQ